MSLNESATPDAGRPGWGADTRRFLERAVAWPASDEDAGYVNIHYMRKTDSGARLSGKPYKTVQSAVAGIARNLQDPRITDHWYCTSQQAKCKVTDKGYVFAERNQEQALLMKSLWIDIDVKPEDLSKGYATFEDALEAFQRFYKQYGLPAPSVLVKSGGGLHVYWVFPRGIPTAEWFPIATHLKALLIQDGLKCDAHICNDSARIMRVPETFNYKTGEKRPVELIWFKGPDYEPEVLWKILEPYTPQRPESLSGSAPLPETFKGAKPSAVFAGQEIETGAEGVEREKLHLEVEPILRGCPFLKNEIIKRGAGTPEPLWDSAVLAATFLENGRAIAHRLSEGYDGYEYQKTEEKFNRKEEWAKTSDGGWPTCAGIREKGCKACATCPHFGKIKSPLNLGLPKASGVSGVVVPPITQETKEMVEGLQLPERYTLDPEGHISIKRDDGYERLFECLIGDPQIHRNPTLSISFTCTLGQNGTTHVTIPRGAFYGQTLMKEVCDQGVAPNAYLKNPARQIGAFLMDWTTMLQNRKKMTSSKMLGWVEGTENNKHQGFAYGGKIWYADNSPPASIGYSDPVIRNQYEPRGSIEPWKIAARLTIEHDSPDLSIILAGAFAAPLVTYTNQTGAITSVYGEGGIGKSTASKTGAAVWGHPVATRFALQSTANSFGNRLGKIVSLPVFWDEVKEDADFKEVATAIFSAVQGNEKQRMLRDGNLKEGGTWKTLLSITSNRSVFDYMLKNSKAQAPALLRVFEMKSSMLPTGNKLDHHAADQLVGALDHNYGMVGLDYVRYLVKNEQAVNESVIARGRAFDLRVGYKQEERFWSNVAASILTGAEIARELGFAEFDVKAMEDYMAEAVYAMRKRRGEEVLDTYDAVEEKLTTFLKTVLRSTIVTDTAPQKKAGRSGRVLVLHGLSEYDKKGIDVQFLRNDELLRISIPKLEEWMKSNGLAEGSVYGLLQKHYEIRRDRITLGAGTQYAVGQERVLEFKLKEGSELHNTMLSLAPPKEDVGGA